MPLSLHHALVNYRLERRRLAHARHPRTGCNCSFCDVIRAADLLFNAGAALQASIDLYARRNPVMQQHSLFDDPDPDRPLWRVVDGPALTADSGNVVRNVSDGATVRSQCWDPTTRCWRDGATIADVLAATPLEPEELRRLGIPDGGLLES